MASSIWDQLFEHTFNRLWTQLGLLGCVATGRGSSTEILGAIWFAICDKKCYQEIAEIFAGSAQLSLGLRARIQTPVNRMEERVEKRTTSLDTEVEVDSGGYAAFLSRSEWKRIGTILEFSPRESEIAALLLASHSDPEVASMLGISSHTVHSHLERLYRKLSVRSRTGLLLRIFETYVHFQRSRDTRGA